MIIAGKSDSTLINYSRHLARLALHFNMLPLDIPIDSIDDYLYQVKQRHNTPSLNFFKFTVYSLRFAYRMAGLKDKYISLPSIKESRKLPVVLSKQEVKRLLETPDSLKHRVLLTLLYGCGLRCFEARNVRVADLDFDRRMLHVRRGKGRKDRYVPISTVAIELFKEYIATKPAGPWLFNGKPTGSAGGDFDSRYSKRGIHWAVRHVAQKAQIIKEVSAHTLRHSFATHLLEDGLDIVTIKNLLGHNSIETTMVYLHVARCGRGSAFSPLDTLYGVKSPLFKHGICPYYVNSVNQESNAVPEKKIILFSEN
ncbi:MAG TPA: tyrosine-type recombinase/integrase [Flavobacterium sp.]|jgi:site-specific recombinase XerD